MGACEDAGPEEPAGPGWTFVTDPPGGSLAERAEPAPATFPWPPLPPAVLTPSLRLPAAFLWALLSPQAAILPSVMVIRFCSSVLITPQGLRFCFC